MSRSRKVNAPASRRRVRPPQGPHRLESAPPESGWRTFLLLGAGVVAVLASAAGLAVAVPRWLPQPPPPWETYRERMVEDPDRSRQEGRQVFVYRYPPNEPDRWIRGVRAADLARDTFRQVVGQAVELLRPADAARVLLAAAAAHPDRAEDWQPGVAAVSGRLSPSLPEERDLRARLQALGAPAP